MSPCLCYDVELWSRFSRPFQRNVYWLLSWCLSFVEVCMALVYCDKTTEARTVRNLRWSSYIGCRLSKELHTSTTSTSDKHQNTCQTVYPQLLNPVADTDWGGLAQRFTFCQEQELDLENMVSSTPVQPPATLFLPNFMTLLTPLRKRHKSVLFDRAYYWLLSVLLDVLYSGALQISRWADWLIDKNWSETNTRTNKKKT